jgi:hypothetical protein
MDGKRVGLVGLVREDAVLHTSEVASAQSEVDEFDLEIAQAIDSLLNHPFQTLQPLIVD